MKQILSVVEFIDYLKLIRIKPDQQIPCLVLCAGTGGQASGSNDIMKIIKRHIIEHNLHDKISLRITGCLGFCEMDPFLIVEPGNNVYPKLQMEDVPKIINAAIDGKVLEDMLYKQPDGINGYRSQQEIPFFMNQTRTILGKNQLVDPIRIYNYINGGGYSAFKR